MSLKCFVPKGCLLICFPHTGFQPTCENIHLFYSTMKSSYMLLFAISPLKKFRESLNYGTFC